MEETKESKVDKTDKNYCLHEEWSYDKLAIEVEGELVRKRVCKKCGKLVYESVRFCNSPRFMVRYKGQFFPSPKPSKNRECSIDPPESPKNVEW